MAATRCRSCKVVAPGSEVPVFERAGATTWHLCGRCWGLLVVGLRHQDANADLDPFSDLSGRRLRPAHVRAAIREGLTIASRHTFPAQPERDEVLRHEQRLLAELKALAREVEDSDEYQIPAHAWRDVRHRVLQLRTEMRELRQLYASARSRDRSALQNGG